MVAILFFIRNSNSNGIVFHQILLKKWTNYYHFLAHVASTRSSSDSKEGALLIDTKTFKVGSILRTCSLFQILRRFERVFRCYTVCETMEDYKGGCLMVWANYMSPCNSIVGLYFKGTCDVISVTMATHKVHKSVL